MKYLMSNKLYGFEYNVIAEIVACLDDVVLENYSMTKLWFYKLKRRKTVVEKKEVMSEVSKTLKRLQF